MRELWNGCLQSHPSVHDFTMLNCDCKMLYSIEYSWNHLDSLKKVDHTLNMFVSWTILHAATCMVAIVYLLCLCAMLKDIYYAYDEALSLD